jgi:hypothetical protein
MSKPDNNHTPGGGQLIPITNMGEGDQAVQAVLGRDLHEYLEVGASYRHWFPRMVAYGFEEGVDYVVKNDRSASPAGMPSRPRLNHVVSLDMAKEIAMIQRSAKGRQARRYFIEVEKRARMAPAFDPSQLTRSEILLIALNAEEERLALEAANKQLRPKADAYDCFIDSTGSYSMGTVAKMLGIGQNTLFRELRNRGILITKGDMRNTPYQRYATYFEVKAGDYTRSNGTQVVTHTTRVRPRGIDFIRRTLGLHGAHPMLPMTFQ